MNETQTVPKKERRSNIELLRIVSMLMIVYHHLASHGVEMTYFDNKKCFVFVWEKGSLINKLSSSFLFPGGEIGVGVFFIITGYFYVKRSKADVSRIIIETSYYGVLLGIFSLIMLFYGGGAA